MKSVILEKLEAIPALANNGYIRLEMLNAAQVRRLVQFKDELVARGNIVFTTNAVYTARAHEILCATSIAKQNELAAKYQAMVNAEQNEIMADGALNAMLARAEAMTMSA